VLGVLPARGDALVANAFGFDVPPGAVELAASAAGPQAFRLGERAWGVQFHPEARREQVLAWWRDETDLPRPLAVLERELADGIEAWHVLGRALCRAFLAVARAAS
jgi:GMP synthase-like glutamine amidotransferase